MAETSPLRKVRVDITFGKSFYNIYKIIVKKPLTIKLYKFKNF